MTATLPATALAPRRIRLLEIVGNAIVGGMESYVARLCERLPADRFAVCAVSPFESRFTDRLRAAGVDVLVAHLPDDPPWATIAAACAYARVRQVDVIHCHLTNGHILGGLVGQLTATPVLFTAHGRQLSPIDLEVHRLTGTHLGVVCPATYYHALGVGIQPQFVHLVPNGVDTEAFRPRRIAAGPLRRELGVPADAPLIGFVGRLSEEKGPETFLRAILMLRHSVPDAHAVMVGDGAMRGQVEAFVQRFGMAGYAHLAGVRDDIPAVLAEVDVFVSTSHSEAMPLSLMEAMAAGVPVVASRVGGVPDMIEHESSGFLVADGDIEGFAASVRALLRDRVRFESFAAAARRRAVERMSLETSVARTAELLATLAEQGAAAAARPAANESIAQVAKAPRAARKAT